MSKSVKKIQTPQNSEEEKQKKLDEQVILLNDIIKLKLAPSDVHGIGVFAMRDIKKGEKLYTDAIPHMFDLPYERFNELDQDIAEQILGFFPQITTGSHFMYPVTKLQAFMNHSDKPNYDAQKDVALKKIKAGEEVFEDYKKIDGWEVVYPWLKK